MFLVEEGIGKMFPAEVSKLDKSNRAQQRESGAVLTPRQREVLQLFAQGLTTKETGELLHIKPRTIFFHKNRIKARFGLKTGSELVRLAIREKVIVLE